MKIIFKSNYNFPLNKILNIPLCVIIVKSFFRENDKYYPQAFLKECFYDYEYKYEEFLMLILSLYEIFIV